MNHNDEHFDLNRDNGSEGLDFKTFGLKMNCYCDCHKRPGVYRNPCSICGHDNDEGELQGGLIYGYWRKKPKKAKIDMSNRHDYKHLPIFAMVDGKTCFVEDTDRKFHDTEKRMFVTFKDDELPAMYLPVSCLIFL